MKPFLCGLALLALSCTVGLAQAENDVNVLSYYAVGNSLDGQPMIDKVNVLRFYPVFAFRNSVTSVKVTVYYGPHVYTRLADSMEGKQYWQVLLPKFELGEAIQRLEVEVGFRVNGIYSAQYASAVAEVENAGRTYAADATNLNSQLLASVSSFTSIVSPRHPITPSEASRESSDPEFQARQQQLIALPNRLKQSAALLNQYSSSYAQHVEESPAVVHANGKLLEHQNLLLNELRGGVDTVVTTAKTVAPGTPEEKIATHIDDLASKASISFAKLQTAELKRKALVDSLRDAQRTRLEHELIDSNYTGLSVRRSDISVNDSLTAARILYRNYKTSLRRIPALDPAEQLGIFRARFVPFAVVGGHLYTPFDSNAKIVFEVGLTFGNAVVAGDDFVVPTFAPERLGVAFVITNDLFSDSARIRALALTYDFNSYGSLGVGANFAGGTVKPYVSFGINKKAFEDVVGELGKLFN
ncbi:MAG: hypothetical protein JST22_20675 [Bacteroidetes bacterium]|nr:hypothetical protein [Bacteroidota bacterium]